MALIQTIRNRAGIIVTIVIGLALFMFILSDLVYKGNLFNRVPSDVGEINGQEISIKEYESLVQDLTDQYLRNTGKENIDDDQITQQIRDEAWRILEENYLFLNNLQSLGIDVHADEVQDMVMGKNVDPQVMQIPIFRNQQTGQFDPNLVKQFILNMDKDPTGNARLSWVAFEKQLKRERLKNKYFNAIRKGFYITTIEAKQFAKYNDYNNHFQYIIKKYTDVPDSLFNPTESEIKNYYDTHKYLFEQEEGRDIEYVVFEIKPSPADIERANEKVIALKEQLSLLTDENEIINFVNQNSDEPFEDKFYRKNELPAPFDSVMFNSPINYTYGPVDMRNNLWVAKLIDIKNLPDSVHARHILIAVNEKRNKEQAKKLGDSLKTLIEQKKAKFEDIAKQYSDDKGSANSGGDLKWFGRNVMVPQFEKAAFESEKGKLVTAETQYGYHIIEVLDKSKESKNVKVAFIKWEIKASNETYQRILSEAYQFAGQNSTYEKFILAVEKQGLIKRMATGLRRNDYSIPGMPSAREVIRWAYKAKKNEVSSPIEYPDKIIVAALTNIREKGYIPLEEVKTQITNSVIKEKKAKKFIDEINAIKGYDLNLISQRLNVPIQDISNINFNSFSIPGLGIEPKIIACASTIKLNQISAPIKANNGVVVLKVIERNKQSETDPKAIQNQMKMEIQNRASYQIYDALKKNAEIVDNRILFY
ncbi:MAG: peptidylprolyl isomerase [Bacteroidales bacterium]|nr:peptidylprolyl isomerase [Bacteroidales bacterium]